MPINTDQFDDLVKNALVQWHEGYEEVPRQARMLYNVKETDVKTSEHSHIDPPPLARRKNEGGSYAVGSPRQGYTLNLTQSRIGLRDSVTYEMRRFDKYDQIMAKMRGLGESTARRMEIDLTHLFTFGLQGSSYTNIDGETVSTTTADGLQIFSDSHTITGGSSLIDNYIGTTAFGRAGLEAGERLFRNMVNMNDEKINPKPNAIVTSDDPEMSNAVREFLGSEKGPDHAEGAINPYKGKYQHIELQYLATDSDGSPSSTGRFYWMLMDLMHKTAVAEFAEFPTFVPPSPGGNGEDFDTDDWNFKSSGMYAYGVLTPTWLVGSAATAV